MSASAQDYVDRPRVEFVPAVTFVTAVFLCLAILFLPYVWPIVDDAYIGPAETIPLTDGIRARFDSLIGISTTVLTFAVLAIGGLMGWLIHRAKAYKVRMGYVEWLMLTSALVCLVSSGYWAVHYNLEMNLLLTDAELAPAPARIADPFNRHVAHALTVQIMSFLAGLVASAMYIFYSINYLSRSDR